MDIPVYLIAGFLDAGKTTFINGILRDGFAAEDRTLLLCCEEGELSYDPKVLGNVFTYTVEDEDDLTPALLKKLEKQYRPKQVIVEYNGMWSMETLYREVLPANWILYQIMCLVDARTFEMYVKNMGQLMMEKITNADLLIFGHCNDQLRAQLRSRNLRMVNRRADIYLENEDGSSEEYVTPEMSPFDLSSGELVVPDADYGVWYVDIMDNPGDAKYGFTKEQLIEGYKKLMKLGAKHFGIHAFIASNTVSNDYYPTLAGILFELAVELKEKTGADIQFINLSGGVGIPYTPDKAPNDIKVIGEGVRKQFEKILVPAGLGDVKIFTELGRFMLGPYGNLVTKCIHQKHIYKEYVGLNTCACDLMRPAMYGSYHHITVMGKEDAPCDHKYDIVGGLCENNDKFAVDRMLPRIDIGDLLVIHDAGAHGLAMGYNYNGKLRCAEVLLQPDGSTRLIRRAETPEDYFATMIWDD